MLTMIEITEHYVRHEGIHAHVAEELAVRLPQSGGFRARNMRETLLEFVRGQAQQARDGEHLLGSSEVIESIIGKYKHLAGEHCQQGLTGLVLGIPAMIGRVALDTVMHALSELTNRDVWTWCKEHLV